MKVNQAPLEMIWEIDEKLKKKAKLPLNIMENCPTAYRPLGAAALLLLHFFS